MAQADVRQYRVTPAQDDETTATSNTLRAAGTGVPEAPYLWAWVEGQTQVRLQWSRGSGANPQVEDHRIEVCAEADISDCDDNDNDDEDWTVLVERHPQAPSTRSNRYTHGGLVAGSTHHYRVSARNSLGHGAASQIKSATTQSMPTSADCTGATWSAYMTVGEFGLHNDKGYRAAGEAGGGDDDGALTNYSFTLGQVTYEVNELWFAPSTFYPTQRLGWIYFPPSYHLALSKYPDVGKLQDLTLYVGGLALRLDAATYSTQSFGEAFRWSTAQIDNLERDERPTSMYEGTFNYRVGDTVEVCLTDSAPTVSLILTPSSISEDDGASTVTAMVEQGSESPFEVTVLVAADSPAAPADFTLSENMVLSFAANAMQSTGIVTITGEDNDVHAPDKKLTVSGELSVGARPTPPGPVKLTIENDDVAPVLSVTVSEAEIVEAGGVSEVVVSTGDTTFAAEQTITLTFTGSAEKDTDYRVSTEELTLPASEHSVTATVTAEQDTVDEDDETILVSATHAGADVGTQQQITITDDDDEPELSITSPTVEEGEPAEFEVTLNPASGREVTVSYMTEDVTATVDDDYTALPSTTLTFVAGETARTLTVATADDTLHEQAETFLVTLSSATNATLEGGGNTLAGTGTINDNDVLPEVSIADATAVVEGAPAEFEVSLDVTSGSEVTVTYATGGTDDTAQPPEDYTAVESTTLTFAVGVQVKTITVATRNDDLDEEDGETFTVTLSAPGNAALATDGTTATGTINDNDDPPKVSITGAPVVTEGTAATFVVELSAESRKTVTVSYATADGTALASDDDYTAVALTELEFAPGATAQTISIATTDDPLDEPDGETFTVTLSAPGNAELATGGETATGTINDNDDEPKVSITGAPVVTEGTAATFVVELSAESRKTVTVSYATADGTALASDDDYTAVAATELEFAPGATAQTISIATTDDPLDEPDGETFTVTLSAPGNAELATGGETATGTINDNDGEPKVSITGAPVVTEGTAATFVVELSAESRKTVTVSYATADGTALASDDDYTAVAATELEFAPGATAQTISIATTDDPLDEPDGETFTVTLSAPGNAELATGGETATGTINDNDGEPKVSIKGAPVVTEGTAASFVVELSAESRKTVTVSYATADGTALASDDDYTAVAATELEFAPGATAQTISIATTDDPLDEPDGETFTVTLSAPGNAELATGGETATGTINDNDGEPKVSIKGAPVVTEGTAATFVVELSAESRKTVTVSYATADGTALASDDDYTAVAATELEFAPGATAQTISIATTDDPLDEPDGETFTVTLSAPGNAELATGGETATGTINDNDGEPKVSITGAPVVVEGTAATFVVELSAESRKTVTVSYATADGTALASDDDYTAVAATELEFAPGATAQTISIATTDDPLDEPDGETFTVTLSAPGNAELATGGETATGTINDNDGEPKVSITGAPVVTEGTAATFVVELSAESRKTVTVSYATADGTALASEDYTAVALTTLEFTSGVTAQTISVATTVDGFDEADGETFTVTLSAPGNAELATGGETATGTINDNDDRAEGEHHGSAGGGRGNRGDVRGGAERGEPQDGDGELRDGRRHGAGERGLHGGGVDGAGVHIGSYGADDQHSDD